MIRFKRSAAAPTRPENPNHMPGQGPLGFLRDISPRRLGLTFTLLVVGLVVTLVEAFYIKSELETAAQTEFEFICSQIEQNISDRLDANALVLYSGAALFYSSNEVNRSEWQVFASKLRIEQQMPGTQGFGFALLIPPEQLASHIQQVRAEGFPDYSVRPEGQRAVYSSIVYLEPFTGRNLRAFGYDMYSEPVRRTAMERARDQNTVALSGKVILVQETDVDVQAGTLMYVPVYRIAQPYTTVEERRAALLGWVYSPYRMDDLMRGTLGNYAFKQGSWHLALQIYDGEAEAEDNLLYDSRTPQEKAAARPALDADKVVQADFYGRRWTLHFTQLGGLASATDYSSYWLALLGGTLVNLLLFGLILSLLQTSYFLASIRRMAETDALTGVYNRRKILELAEGEFTRSRRSPHAFSVLMIDLNHFKGINDSYGHAAGDQALRLTAHAIRTSLRKNIDQVGRYGGDEFIVLLPETALSQVAPVLARLREQVAHHTTGLAPGMPPISLSIGGAELDAATQTLDELIDRADRAMYAEKKQQPVR